MKQLKFSEPLPELILNRQKDTTWRINDEKNIATGDMLSLCDNDANEFARAEVIVIEETVFGSLSEDDKNGHEKFSTEQEMYRVYSSYYKMDVTPETTVKVIKFRLI